MKKAAGFSFFALALLFALMQIYFILSKKDNTIKYSASEETSPNEDYWDRARDEIFRFIVESGSSLRADTACLIATSITANSENFDLNPYVVAAVIYSESRFRHDVVGSSGDAGLMQIIPSTAKLIAEAFSERRFNIKDIDTNIKYGCWYLSFIKTRYGGNYIQALGMYNQGGNWKGAGERYAQRVISQAESRGLPLSLLIVYDEMNIKKNICQ
ncbi:transglycosylase SLT domain-containing protein [candidate division WOR-3 bacterium]|nr:transglycosylase SLT domain-containing protein [candidate division WOR-3 bacterium]